MRVSILQERLKMALDLAHPFTRNRAIPICGMVLLSADTEAGVSVRANDLETAITLQMDMVVEQAGSVGIDAARFRALVNTLKQNEVIDLELLDNGDDGLVLSVCSDSVIATLDGTSAADFPPPPVVTGSRRHCCCLLYTSPSPRDRQKSRMPSSA